ncbi:MAG: IS4 family transposase, partial [Proteobacteria bacterium]|nr:IS4 family transposase [Pseudomonadota bacterium]
DRALMKDETSERPYLYSRLKMELPVAQRFANLSARKAKKGQSTAKKARRRNRARKPRKAVLDIRAAHVRLRIPDQARGEKLPTSVAVNVVSVIETNPPRGQEPVNWTLLTSEPIDTVEDLKRIIDYYRARWLIEEFFKAIKTGCNYEKAQLESYRALRIQLAMTLPVAYQLLRARYLSRVAPATPASEIFRPTMLSVLRYELNGTFPTEPTVADALNAMASLGGHIKNNGPPGWAVIGRGYQRALLLERGWRAARGLRRSDQS